MKKILSLTLAVLMLVSALPMAYALEGENTYDNNYEGQMGTTITLNGSGTEEWTVTVPAKMVPGDTGTVKAEGTWAADKFLNVGAPSTVALTYGAQSMDVAITGGKFSLIGNSVDPVSKEVEISVADASRLFGTWEGILVYQIDLIQKGDVNRNGIIDVGDATMAQRASVNALELTEEQTKYADITGDGAVSSNDAQLISEVVAGNYVAGAINGTAATE